MKIGILTHHWVANFGANLQAYATSSYLSSMGHEVVFINFRPRFVETKYEDSIPEKQLKAHESFIEKYLKETRIVRNLDGFYEIVDEMQPDCLLTGSDAVFRLQHAVTREDQVFPNPFWLPVKKNGSTGKPMKVALSASAMGCRFAKLPRSVQKGIRQSVLDMDHVSVRDEWTAIQLKKTGIRKWIQVTQDPVFLLRDKINSMKNAAKKKAPYILVTTSSVMGKEWMEKFSNLCNKRGFHVVSLPLPEGKWDRQVHKKVEFPLTPFEWMNYIANADGYVGVRFHPIVISLIANIPFVSLDLYHKGFWDASSSKTVNLLRNYHLQKYAYSRLRRPILSPDKVLNLLEKQEKARDHIKNVSFQMKEALECFFDNFLRRF